MSKSFPYITDKDSLTIWRSLGTEKRAEIKRICFDKDLDIWKKVWNALFFSNPIKGLTSQKWRNGLVKIKNSIEERHFFAEEHDIEKIKEVDNNFTKKDIVIKKFSKQLIERQRNIGTENRLVSKTLCNIAALAKKYDKLLWSQELYKEALSLNLNDPIPYSRLARIFVLMGRLTTVPRGNNSQLLYLKNTA